MNPIIRRELIEVLRTRKAVAAQLGLALACALLVLVRWPTGEVADLNGVRAQQVLRMFGYGLLPGPLHGQRSPHHLRPGAGGDHAQPGARRPDARRVGAAAGAGLVAELPVAAPRRP